MRLSEAQATRWANNNENDVSPVSCSSAGMLSHWTGSGGRRNSDGGYQNRPNAEFRLQSSSVVFPNALLNFAV